MKRIIGLLMLSVASCFAVDQPQTQSPFEAKEWNISLFGSSTHPATGANFFSDMRGGLGLGGAYFLNQYIGFGGSAESADTRHSAIDQTQLDLIGRLPFGNSRFAGYGKAGVGYQFEERAAFIHEGIGLEYRFTKNVGSFAEGEYVSPIGGADRVVFRAGLRLSFR